MSCLIAKSFFELSFEWVHKFFAMISKINTKEKQTVRGKTVNEKQKCWKNLTDLKQN